MQSLSFSTTSVRPHERLSFWNEVAADALARMRISPLDEGRFAGELHAGTVGELGVGVASSSRSRLQRTRTDIAASAGRVFLLHLALRGSFVIRQRDREGVVEAGDFAISDAGEPFDITHRSPCMAGVLRIPEASLCRVVPDPARLAGRAMSGRSGSGALAAATIRSLCREIIAGRGAELNASVAAPVILLIASACAEQLGAASPRESAASDRRFAIRRFIESHLAEPSLHSDAVARHFGISTRYLRMLFADEGESVAACIARRRLEECACRLADPRWRDRTISDIAFAWGFNSLGSFDRAFKQHSGLTPQQFRAASTSAPSAPLLPLR